MIHTVTYVRTKIPGSPATILLDDFEVYGRIEVPLPGDEVMIDGAFYMVDNRRFQNSIRTEGVTKVETHITVYLSPLK